MFSVVIIILVVIGAALGSFLNVLIWRLPRKESIVYPSSHCGDCGKPIPLWWNIPIISWILLGGKCKHCGARIHWHHLLVEIIAPSLLIVLFLQYGLFNVVFFKYALLALWMIPIFFIDAFHQIIPHKLSIPLIPVGLAFALFAKSDVGIVNAAVSGGVMFGFLLLLAYGYRIARKVDGLGGGDIWLLTGVATFLGLISLPFVVLLASLMGIVYFLVAVRDTNKVFAFGNFIALSVLIWICLGGESILGYLPI
ncbi:MAG: prepilin peptidase [Candidatus Cloacimonetes bacterium]|nr:prepilin peptidase [Candidatus Cloacimonadota bacterium]MDD4805178.1 prepilin peptidase [Candidatus Cloacimonadota bacterium]